MVLTLPVSRLTTWSPLQLHLHHQWVKHFLLAYTFHSKTVWQQREETKSRDIFPRPMYSGSPLCSPVPQGKFRGSALNKT